MNLLVILFLSLFSITKSGRLFVGRHHFLKASTRESTKPENSPTAKSRTAELVPRFIVLGAPAAGKGTQCDAIMRTFGVVHLSTGDLLREAVRMRTTLGQRANPYIEQGKLVPDEIVIELLLERINRPDCIRNGWLLDGFPRTEFQAEMLRSKNLLPVAVIFIDVPEELLLERIFYRRVDPLTNTVYHLKFNPPPTEEIANRMIQRPDDTAHALKSRLAAFQKHVSAVNAVFSDRLYRVDGNDDSSVVASRVLKILSDAMTRAHDEHAVRQENADSQES